MTTFAVNEITIIKFFTVMMKMHKEGGWGGRGSGERQEGVII